MAPEVVEVSPSSSIQIFVKLSNQMECFSLNLPVSLEKFKEQIVQKFNIEDYRYKLVSESGRIEISSDSDFLLLQQKDIIRVHLLQLQNIN